MIKLRDERIYVSREPLIIEKTDDVIENRRFQIILKRIFDVVFSLIGLIILLPVFLAIAIVVKLDSKGPAFFKQVRVGKDGKEFEILKFRTMVENAEKKGMQITVGKDNRITKSGHFLRKFKLDELPQLINVLIGEMSFVGPRPEVPKYVAMYDEYQRSVLKIRPGITDVASIYFRIESDILEGVKDPESMYISSIMPYKLELNKIYLNNISIWNDFKLIVLTVYAILGGKVKIPTSNFRRGLLNNSTTTYGRGVDLK